MKETKEEEILKHKEMITECRHRLKDDDGLACHDISNLESEIKNSKIKIANLNGLKGITGYWNLRRFKRELVDLIFDANKENCEKLRKAYPELVNICRGTQK